MSGSDRSAPGDGKFFRILSLDGGGIRGVFPAAFLARLEDHLEHPIGRYFDLIAGTSTAASSPSGSASACPPPTSSSSTRSRAPRSSTRSTVASGIGCARSYAASRIC